MPIRNLPERWGGPSIVLHWLSLILVLALAIIGLLMSELPNSAFKVQVYALHKSLGLSVLGLTAVRLLWRLAAGSPGPVPGTPRWMHAAAQATHGALYALLLLMPLSGWLYNSASGFPLKFFGWFDVPALSGRDPQLKAFAHEAHEWLFIALAVLVTVHAAAALYHHYRRRDATLARMLPLAKPPAEGDGGRN
ncbi:cytochrome b [Arenimonas fontis]|uniref:Cytochrome b n=1 Tax=Arenimonas fontis TaxID=2608255 RepID=A0A5B2ZDR5_9GAMM|nr:cytochrome b [Arenimonas fontis]KAA2285181.1 cytochrome b [Arenimonas fontis]